jgi:radical SAM enzyme (TIGR01210 family)
MVWPVASADRDRVILSLRPPRPDHDPWRLQGVRVEDEPGPDGTIVRSATLFLTGRECPWRCAMCDLWQYTTAADTPAGAIPAQIAAACHDLDARGDAPEQAKLYNAGSFFDPRAVPEDDYPAIATLLRRFRHVVVESHPALIGRRVDALLTVLEPSLEVAIGLETAHPDALGALNKRMDVAMFLRAAATLQERGIGLRVFLLIAPPFIPAAEQDAWLLRSLDVAIGAGASVVSLIPTRGGNGSLEMLHDHGLFAPPDRESVTRAAALATAHAGNRVRVLLDPWDGTGVTSAA